MIYTVCIYWIKYCRIRLIRKLFQMTLHVILPFKNRINYVRLCAATLAEALKGHDDVHVRAFDHNSDQPVPDILKETVHKVIRHDAPIVDPRGPGRVVAKIITDEFKEHNTDHIFILESDAVLHPLAFDVVKTMIEELPDMGLGSIFNTHHHPDTSSVNQYVRKESLGLFCSIIRRQAWDKHNGLMLDGGGGYSFSEALRGDDEYDLYCTYNSYAEHMGYEGINIREDDDTSNRVDRARRFMND